MQYTLWKITKDMQLHHHFSHHWIHCMSDHLWSMNTFRSMIIKFKVKSWPWPWLHRYFGPKECTFYHADGYRHTVSDSTTDRVISSVYPIIWWSNTKTVLFSHKHTNSVALTVSRNAISNEVAFSCEVAYLFPMTRLFSYEVAQHKTFADDSKKNVFWDRIPKFNRKIIIDSLLKNPYTFILGLWVALRTLWFYYFLFLGKELGYLNM